ncbi:MAG: glycosyltransferase family 2 protein [archaeon]
MNGKAEKNKLPKVLVGCPVSDYHEYCTEEFIQSIKTLSYPNYDILLIDNSKDDRFFNSIKDKVPIIRGKYFTKIHDRLAYNRNLLRQKVIDENYDYFFNVDQDVIPPRDAIERMVSGNKKITTGIYFNPWEKRGEKRLLATIWVCPPNQPEKLVAVREDIVQGDNLIKIDSCGSGCLLIHRTVLEKIKFRYDLNEGEGVDDVFFCQDAKKNDFEIYADTSIKCKHMLSGRTWRWNDMLSGKI